MDLITLDQIGYQPLKQILLLDLHIKILVDSVSVIHLHNIRLLPSTGLTSV